MDEITRILRALEEGEPEAADELISAAYRELRKLAASKMAREKKGHTLQATALVHEAYLRLQTPDGRIPQWNSRGHFFAAAAEAMRRILIKSARRKCSEKRGNNPRHTSLDEERIEIDGGAPPDRLLEVNDALTRLEEQHPAFAEVVKMRYFAGMTVAEIAAALDTSESTVNRTWKSAKVWLYREIGESAHQDR